MTPCPIKEFINLKTEHSTDPNDALKMTDIYNAFVEWVRMEYPTHNIPSQRHFTINLRDLKMPYIIYRSSINSLNSTSGLANRKWI